ncbi:MAG: hypothetical protein ACYCPO_06335 [Acidobacteriaceae bacterium]
MSESLETIKKLVNECSADERRALRIYLDSLLPHPLETEWGIDSDTILSAIRRSSDLTKRGVRGIIAEAVFENEVIPLMAASGWKPTVIEADRSFDAILQKGTASARIQIKLQRLEKGVPKLYYPNFYQAGSYYVVEVQKTRSGEKTKIETLPGTGTKIAATKTVTVKTRPYRFGDFDVLAVNMHPSSGDWKNFRYTLGEWLLPRPADQSLIEIFQPVAAIPNDAWTDDLETCLKWFESGVKRQVLVELLHVPKKN